MGREVGQSNVGAVSNKGIEINLTYNGQIGRDFRFSISPNFTWVKNAFNISSFFWIRLSIIESNLVSGLSSSWRVNPFSMRMFCIAFSALVFSPPSPFSTSCCNFSIFSERRLSEDSSVLDAYGRTKCPFVRTFEI